MPNHIDHINGDRADNRISNLRNVSAAENMKNQSHRRDSNTPYPGVRWKKGKWRVDGQSGGVRRHLGSFASLADAVKCKKRFEIQHGFGPAHGKGSRFP